MSRLENFGCNCPKQTCLLTNRLHCASGDIAIPGFIHLHFSNLFPIPRAREKSITATVVSHAAAAFSRCPPRISSPLGHSLPLPCRISSTSIFSSCPHPHLAPYRSAHFSNFSPPSQKVPTRTINWCYGRASPRMGGKLIRNSSLDSQDLTSILPPGAVIQKLVLLFLLSRLI